MELDGLDELRRMGNGILELVATLADDSEIWSMVDCLLKFCLHLKESVEKSMRTTILFTFHVQHAMLQPLDFQFPNFRFHFMFSFTFGGIAR